MLKKLLKFLVFIVIFAPLASCETDDMPDLETDEGIIEFLLLQKQLTHPTVVPFSGNVNRVTVEPKLRTVIIRTDIPTLDTSTLDGVVCAYDHKSGIRHPYDFTEYGARNWDDSKGDYWEQIPDTAGYIVDVNKVRENLTITPDREAFFCGFPVVAIEDVVVRQTEKGPYYNAVMNEMDVYVRNADDVEKLLNVLKEKFGAYITPRDIESMNFDWTDDDGIHVASFHLPLGVKTADVCIYLDKHSPVKLAGFSDGEIIQFEF